MHGGGQKNLFSLPYDFWATLACKMRTLISFLSLRYLRIRLELNCFWEEDDEDNSNDGKFKIFDLFCCCCWWCKVDEVDDDAELIVEEDVGGSGRGGSGGGGSGGGEDNCKLTGKCGPNENDEDKK